MKAFKSCSKFLSLLFILTVFATGCGAGSGNVAETDGGDSESVTPASTPADGTTGTNINGSIIAQFSEALDPATVNSDTFMLAAASDDTPVDGVVSYTNNTMIFTPAANLAESTEYTATVSSDVLSASGSPLLDTDLVWNFTTGETAGTVPALDTTAPSVNSTDPANGAAGVSLNRSATALFSEVLDPATVSQSAFTLAVTSGDVAVAGVVSYIGNTMTFNPAANLAGSTEYTAIITTAVTDLAGNALAADKVWSFTTGAITDTTAPEANSTNPADSDTGVPIDRSVSALFSETLAPDTVGQSSFKLATTVGDTPVAGAVSYANKTMVFNPTADLDAVTEYTATITTAVKDLAGNALAVNLIWSFTTGAAPTSALAPVNLGTAGNFVILAKTGISTTGTTAITGDVGLSPAARTYITGFSDTLFSDGTYSTSPLVTGKIYASNMTAPTPSNMTTAVSNMETAYTDAAGRSLPDYTELYAGDVSGKILTPGLYKWGTGLLITDAGVTISGSATDVWIFQIAGDLTVNNGAIVTLAGGALAKNIFWQVGGGTGVTLGTTADFKGIALAEKAISVNTGAIVNGRLLSQTAVTLDANAVTEPAD